MSASDSDLSEASRTPAPPDHELERSLRREVVKAQRDGVDFSNNYIRAASEAKLGLTKGFYKNHEEWAQRSKDIIADQLTIQSSTQSSPVKRKPAEVKKTPTKRKSSEKEAAPKKRQKAAAKVDDDGSDDLSSPLSDLDSEALQEKPKTKQRKAVQKPRPTKSKPAQAKRAKVAASDDEGEDEEKQVNGAVAEESSNEGKTAVADNGEDGSESEMSVLLDEAPQTKRKDSVGPKPKKPTSKASTKPKADADMDSEQAEIKRLQGWLVKCGIRKLWGKELKPYQTPKAKIKHLKEMLADVGMTGRYSLEKANQIKEARELAADIEAVQEGAERWGATEDAVGARGEKATDSDARPAARRLVRGAKNYDFLSSDGEETD